MRLEPRRPSCLAAVLIVLAAAPAALAETGTRIGVNAGLGGTVRPGRWTAVALTIENTGPALAGDLVVEIGGARLVEHVDVPSPSRKELAVYLRVPSDADRFVTVSLASLDPIRLPLRLAGDDAPVTVCVGAVHSADCTATVDAGAAPQSWRGYDMADTVIIAAGTELTPRQRTAYDRWRAVRHWSTSTNMVPPPAPPIAVDGHSRASVLLAAYVGLLAILCAAAPAIRTHSGWVHGAVALMILGASAAVLADGRIAGSADIVVEDASVVRGAAGFSGSAVSARGVAWFPAASRHAITTPLDDGAVGAPASTVFRKGEKLPFDVEGFTSETFVASEPAGGTLTLKNVSRSTLADCAFPEGFEPRAVPDLPPGAGVTVTAAPDAVDPVLVCTIRGALHTLQVRGARIRHSGTATLLYDLRPLEAPQ